MLKQCFVNALSGPWHTGRRINYSKVPAALQWMETLMQRAVSWAIWAISALWILGAFASAAVQLSNLLRAVPRAMPIVVALSLAILFVSAAPVLLLRRMPAMPQRALIAILMLPGLAEFVSMIRPLALTEFDGPIIWPIWAFQHFEFAILFPLTGFAASACLIALWIATGWRRLTSCAT